MMILASSTTPTPDAGTNLSSLFDMLIDGGPMMVPIALCSVVALAYTVERSIRLRDGELGSQRLGDSIVAALRSDGPQNALDICDRTSKPLGRVLGAGLRRFRSPVTEMEKAVEDAGSREIEILSGNLRPLVVVSAIAPLLGLLGTVIGMIKAFQVIAVEKAIGKPELLAEGISQALVTTAAGLIVAIPAQVAYFYLKSRIDRFGRDVESIYTGILGRFLDGGGRRPDQQAA